MMEFGRPAGNVRPRKRNVRHPTESSCYRSSCIDLHSRVHVRVVVLRYVLLIFPHRCPSDQRYALYQTRTSLSCSSPHLTRRAGVGWVCCWRRHDVNAPSVHVALACFFWLRAKGIGKCFGLTARNGRAEVRTGEWMERGQPRPKGMIGGKSLVPGQIR